MWEHLGDVYKKLDENTKSQDSYQKALENAKDPKDIKRIRDKIKG